MPILFTGMDHNSLLMAVYSIMLILAFLSVSDFCKYLIRILLIWNSRTILLISQYSMETLEEGKCLDASVPAEEKPSESFPQLLTEDSLTDQQAELLISPVEKLSPEQHQKFLEFKDVLKAQSIVDLKDDFIVRYLVTSKYVQGVQGRYDLKEALRLVVRVMKIKEENDVENIKLEHVRSEYNSGVNSVKQQ